MEYFLGSSFPNGRAASKLGRVSYFGGGATWTDFDGFPMNVYNGVFVCVSGRTGNREVLFLLQARAP